MIEKLLFFGFLLLIGFGAKAQERGKSLTKGQRPAAYVFRDATEKERSLSEFKGKFVLIDVWASWCTHCQKEFPALDTLRRHYRDSNLVVLGISIDTRKFRWDGSMNHFKLPEPQFIIGEEKRFEEEFDIRYIPRMILIAPDGSVYNEYMPKPSNPEIYTILDKALAKKKKNLHQK